MKHRTLFLAVTFILFGASLSFAQVAATVGTWKNNEAKSKIPARFMHINSDTYEAQGDQIKVVSSRTPLPAQPRSHPHFGYSGLGSLL